MKANRRPATLFGRSAAFDCLAVLERRARHERTRFASIQFETGREKRGVPSEKAPSSLFIYFFWWKISSCQEAFRKEHTHARTANDYMHMHIHNLIVSHIRNFNQSTSSFCSHLSAIQSAVGFCLCQITSSICQPN